MCLQCAVCLDPLCAGPCSSIDCGHVFHQKCIDGILQNLQPTSRAQCPVCRKAIGTLQKLYINHEICTQGVEYKRMKRQMRQSTEKQSNQDQIIESMETKYEELRRKYRKLKADEKEWRKDVALLETENDELTKKTQSAAKALKAKPVASTKTPPKKIKHAETDANKKVTELQEKLREEREKHRREKNELQEKMKKLKSECCEKLEPEYTATVEIQPRRKMPVRECRRRTGSYYMN